MTRKSLILALCPLLETGQGNITNDPHFADYAAGDFRIESSFRIQEMMQKSVNGKMIIRWPSIQGKLYRVNTCTNLGSGWSNVYKVFGNGFFNLHSAVEAGENTEMPAIAGDP